MRDMKTALIDLSNMVHRLWHSDPENVEHKITNFLKTLQAENIIVAMDSPPYKRKDIYPQYKANRDKPDPDLVSLFDNVKRKILLNGFKIAYAEGWEADDVIATIINDMIDKGTYEAQNVLVYAKDKDLMQITDLIDPFDGKFETSETRLGVKQYQVADFLALTGDTSDNIPGVDKVGEKTAIALLTQFNSIDGIYKAIDETPEKFSKPAIFEALKAARESIKISQQLTVLNCAVQIKYEQGEVKETKLDEIKIPEHIEEKTEAQNAVVLRTEPVSYSRSLEPIDFKQAWQASVVFNKSGLYPKFKGPEQMIMIVMRGRELGIGATTALDVIDMIQGKPTMKAAGMLALVMQHRDVCKYIQCVESSETRSVWKTHRIGYPVETTTEFTIEDADRMGLTGKDNWKKQPKTMLKWRACSQIIREVYPDIINGLYATEEFE